jgi:hypothetical protein
MQPVPQWNDATGISLNSPTAVRNGRLDDLSERLALPVQYREAFGDSLACRPQRTMPMPATLRLICQSLNMPVAQRRRKTSGTGGR